MAESPLFLFWSHTKGLLVLLHSSFESATKVDTDPKQGLSPFIILPLMTDISVFMSLQGIIPWKSWLRGEFLWRTTKLYENKITFGNFNSTKGKMAKDGGNNYFRDVVPIMSCRNWSWIMNSRIYGEGITQIPLRYILWHKIQDKQGLYRYKSFWQYQD